MTTDAGRFRNLILSSNPCPKCIEAASQDPMTIDEWIASQWGLPGSSGRYCEDDCHCLLVPEGTDVPEPLFGKEKLRGEEKADIKKVIEFGSAEIELKDLMDRWNLLYGVLPAEIYTMPVGEVAAYLKALFSQLEG
jgi:hypothetical protein